MTLLTGHLLVPTSQNPDTGLWFIFHHESDGVLAFDLTREHPDIPYRYIESALTSDDGKALEDKIVLLGGPNQSDTAMLVLHNNPVAGQDQHILNDDFAFKSYRYVLIPGKPPAITTADNAHTRINLKDSTDFIVTVGFRLWDMGTLEQELKNWQWTIIPATPELVFHTHRRDRLQKARLSIN